VAVVGSLLGLLLLADRCEGGPEGGGGGEYFDARGFDARAVHPAAGPAG
jgi:hypothetical protein